MGATTVLETPPETPPAARSAKKLNAVVSFFAGMSKGVATGLE